MAKVWVSIGSNQDREHHVRGAVLALQEAFGDVCVSRVYETEAVGFEGAAFFNLVAGFDTQLGAEQVLAQLHDIEERHGRDRSLPKFGSRTLDIDLLLYGDFVGDVAGKTLPHQDVLSYAFVLRPLAELIPFSEHPVLHRAYEQLWMERELDEGAPMVVVPFQWIGGDGE